MDAKGRLQNYQNLKKEHEQLREMLDKALTLRHVGLQEFYRAKLKDLAAEQMAIEKAIDRLDDVQRRLMHYRYIDGLKWEEVCDHMNYSWTQIHRIHADILVVLEAALSVKEN